MKGVDPDLLDLVSRRTFLSRGATGMGGFALASLLGDRASGDSTNGPAVAIPAAALPHYAARAKRIIFLFMAGAPSQLDLFDYKPMLNKLNGKTANREMLGDVRFSQIRSRNGRRPSKLLGSPYQFKKYGESGPSSRNCCRIFPASWMKSHL